MQSQLISKPSFFSKQTMGYLAILLASILWGTTGTVASFAVDVSASSIAAITTGGGGLLLFLSALPHYKGSLVVWRKNIPLTLLAVLCITCYPLAFYTSMQLSGVAIGTVVSIGSAPIASAIIERTVEKVPLTTRWMMACILGLIGVTMLSIATHLNIEETTNLNAKQTLQSVQGIALGIIAGITYACYSWSAKRLISKELCSKTVMGVLFGLASMLLLPIAVQDSASFLSSWHNSMIGLYLAVIPMFFGYRLFGYGLSHSRVSTATTLTLFEPVVATILSIVIVGEILSTQAWFGLALILTSLLVIMLPHKWLSATKSRYGRISSKRRISADNTR
ncbi:EamA family transporter [Vibrio sp. 99-8-1]|uniref:DMT family transporter n=1 Tax=Vibrio sp. 99-8-1 TaxID=2607602 RepID=UPI0014933221|nr:EamA family transporter [Vibrio sp. 99-8-1]